MRSGAIRDDVASGRLVIVLGGVPVHASESRTLWPQTLPLSAGSPRNRLPGGKPSRVALPSAWGSLDADQAGGGSPAVPAARQPERLHLPRERRDDRRSCFDALRRGVKGGPAAEVCSQCRHPAEDLAQALAAKKEALAITLLIRRWQGTN